MLDDARIRQMVLQAVPDIDPYRLEVSELDYGKTVGWWLRNDQGYRDHGKVEALNRKDGDIAVSIAQSINMVRCGTVIEEVDLGCVLVGEEAGPTWTDHDPKVDFITTHEPSPYEGKGGRHPNNCTCSKHRA